MEMGGGRWQTVQRSLLRIRIWENKIEHLIRIDLAVPIYHSCQHDELPYS